MSTAHASVDLPTVTVDGSVPDGATDGMPTPSAEPLVLPDFSAQRSAQVTEIGAVPTDASVVRIVLGGTSMHLEDALTLSPDTLVPLDQLVGEPAAIWVDGRRAARGEILKLGNRFCVRVVELSPPEPAAA